MSAAAAQALLDTNSSITLSFAVEVFEKIPRWPSSLDTFQFSGDYIRAVVLSALIPFLSGLALSILLLTHIIIRFSCRRRTTDLRFHKLNRSKPWTIAQSLVSFILFFCIFACVSLGILGNAGLNSSTQDAVSTLEGLLIDIRRTGLALVDVGILLRTRLENFDSSEAPIPRKLTDEFGNVFANSLDALQAYSRENYPQLGPLRTQVVELAVNIKGVLEDVRVAVGVVYAVLLALILILTFAPLLLHTGHWVAMADRPRPTRSVFYILYMILVALAWLLVGAFSTVGIAVADVCKATHDYRTVLLGGSLSMDAMRNNPLISSGFVCPNVLDPERLTKQINDTASSVLQSDLARKTVELLLNTTAQDVADASSWSGDEVKRYVDCSALIEFSGMMEFIICGEEGQSTVEGVYDLWIAFLGLALFFMAGLFISLLGFNMARWFNVTETGLVKGWNTVISGKTSDEDQIDPDLSRREHSIEMERKEWRTK